MCNSIVCKFGKLSFAHKLVAILLVNIIEVGLLLVVVVDVVVSTCFIDCNWNTDVFHLKSTRR